jgi:diguanylate cyclase (GGDEF)-like protein
VDVTGIPEPGGWQDPLTGLEGPDAWQRTLVEEVARSARYHRSLTIVVLEIDGILEMGDAWGVDVARHALREAGEALRRESRTGDVCFRIGRTRFGVVLTETDEVLAINYVERVRESAPRRLPLGGAGLRLSFGWASPAAGEPADTLARRADHRLVQELLR